VPGSGLQSSLVSKLEPRMLQPSKTKLQLTHQDDPKQMYPIVFAFVFAFQMFKNAAFFFYDSNQQTSTTPILFKVNEGWDEASISFIRCQAALFTSTTHSPILAEGFSSFSLPASAILALLEGGEPFRFSSFSLPASSGVI